MKTVWVWMRNIVIGLLIAFFLLTRGQHLYSLRADSDTQIQKKLAQRNDSVEVTSYTVGERTIRYVDIGDKERPMLILFHGAPGGISTRYNLLKTTSLAQRYRVIILDRPGYGDSGGGRAVTALAEQSVLAAPLLDLNQHTSKPILIGHSLGPAIIAKMAVMYPEKIGGLISVAGAFDPEHERVRRASYPMDWKLLRWLIAPGLRVTNREKLTHVRELEILEKELSLITQPLTIMHGDEDWIVPVENAYYIEQHATNAQLDIRIQPERNHFLPFDRTWTIEQAVDDMMTTL